MVIFKFDYKIGKCLYLKDDFNDWIKGSIVKVNMRINKQTYLLESMQLPILANEDKYKKMHVNDMCEYLEECK